MAWSAAWPLSSGADIQKFDTIIELWKATSERHMITQNLRWPKHNVPWGTGTIDSVASYGSGNYKFTQDDENWNITNPACTGLNNQKFVNYNCTLTGTDFEPPAYYDAYIEVDGPLNPKKVVSGPVVENGSGYFVVAGLENYVTAGVISAVSDCNSKKFAIIKRDGLWWSDRVPEWPNDNEIYRGSISSSTTSGITDTTMSWTANSLVGKDLLAYDTSGALKRATISSNTDDDIYFSVLPSSLYGSYIILEAGGVGFPGRSAGTIFKWFDGLKEGWWTHNPGDLAINLDPTSTDMPATQTSWGSPIGFSLCGTVDFDTFDSSTEREVDLWSDFDEYCSEQDDPKTPDLTKTLRYMQSYLEGACTSFIEETNYEGLNYEPPNLTPAKMFALASVNHISTQTETTDGSNIVTFNISNGGDYYYYEIALTSTQSVVETGYTAASGLTYTHSEPGIDFTCIASKGWTRKYPKEFRYLYSRTSFLPEDDGNGGVETVSDAHPGLWETRDASTNYKTHSYLGFVSDGGDTFQDGDKARYSGDNWNDPGINPNDIVETSMPTRPNGYDPLTPYYDFFYEGKLYDAAEAVVGNMKQGIVTSGTAKFIYDNTQNWWGSPIGLGTLRSETGTTTGGSSTRLTDSTKSGNPFWHNTGRWNGFILEILSGSHAGKKVPILTTNNPSSGQVTFSSTYGVVVSGGVDYRIREPAYILNRWKDRQITVVRDDGYSETRTITNNDDKTIFFTPDLSFVPSGGYTYNITEKTTGNVYQWNTGSGWVRASPTNIPENGIAPDTIVSYGKIKKGDYITNDLLNEIYRCLNTLVWTVHNPTWVAREDPNVAELNDVEAGGFISTPDCNNVDCLTMQSDTEAFWVDPLVKTSGESDASPRVIAALQNSCDGVGLGSLQRRYAYLQITVPNDFLGRHLDFYVYPNAPLGELVSECTVNEFNTNGDEGGLFTEDQYFRFATNTDNTDDTRELFGNTDLDLIPEWGTCPPDSYFGLYAPPGACSGTFSGSSVGYIIENEYVIGRWNVGGGINYVDHQSTPSGGA